MKKYTYTIIFILFNLTFVYSFFMKNDEDIISVFESDDGIYQVYNVIYDDGLTINEYKELFTGINYDDYYIMGFKLNKKYNEKMDNEIDDIYITGGNFMATLNEYLDFYEDILYLNNKEEDINLIYSGKTRIKSINIRCTSYVYERIKGKGF